MYIFSFIECKDYKVLHESTRNVKYREGDFECDRSGYDYTSPAWKGSGWYRFIAPAGTRIPESPPAFSNYSKEKVCGTHITGWLNGQHPITPGELVTRKVCFKTNSNNCESEKTTKIRHCGTYFVYHLTDTVACHYRYCAE